MTKANHTLSFSEPRIDTGSAIGSANGSVSASVNEIVNENVNGSVEIVSETSLANSTIFFVDAFRFCLFLRCTEQTPVPPCLVWL